MPEPTQVGGEQQPEAQAPEVQAEPTAAEEAVQEAAKEVVPAVVEEAAKEVVPEAAQEAVKEAAAEVVPEVVKEAAQEEAKKAVAEAVEVMFPEPQNGMMAEGPAIPAPGVDLPGIRAFEAVNALVERRGQITKEIADKKARISEIQSESTAQIALIQADIGALSTEADSLPAKVSEHMKRVDSRQQEIMDFFGISPSD